MHDAMTARVMRAPVGWFEKTPLGRILNRFSSDIQELDKDVMDGLGSTLVCGFSAASIVIVISYTVRNIFLFFCNICMGGFLVNLLIHIFFSLTVFYSLSPCDHEPGCL